MPFGISLPELLILLVVLLLVFGAKRLPEMGRSLGKGMREFKDGVSGVEESVTTPTPTSVELTPPASEPSPQNSTSASSTSVSEPESERQPVS
jgi:sec-independent protein translocase protein TatA